MHRTEAEAANLLALAETLLRLSVLFLHRRKALVLRTPRRSALAATPSFTSLVARCALGLSALR